MPALSAADTIRVLVATDNHVGYNERDPVRGDDSWKTFHEIMCIAKDRDVDMVLLAGDLFHENKPSRKSMYNVMRSLRMNCYGEKPCELEILSDASETLGGDFNHVNYEDPDINVAIPVFSIHGNHDDPSGEGHYAALDILQCSGLLNYYGRTLESDNIHVKPVLLQKGRTKLALYGMSNVRDERLYRTFRDGKVKFFQPGTQKEDWFNIMSVHQNHHAYTETSHLPENFLPDFLDLVIWGHEHECDIQPHINPEMNFKVMQPGSSVATSLVAGEAVPKQVAILSITGREFKSEPIRLKTVRPFVYKELVLSEHKEAMQMARKDNHRTELTRFLVRVVDELIEQAIGEWREAQEETRMEGDDDDDESPEVPLPLIRLRVETSIPDSTASFDVENPQRFSNRFVGKVANINDVVQFHRRKKTALSSMRKAAGDVEEPEIMSHLQGLDTVKVEKLVREFLAAQSLTILPQNYFGDAVSQFIDKDDKHAMESFVNDSLTSQIKHLLNLDAGDDEEEADEENSLAAQMERYRNQLEDMFSKGALKKSKGGKHRFKPKPSNWDSELDGDWEDQPGALLRPDEENGNVMDEEDEEEIETAKPRPTRGRGRGRGARGGGNRATTKTTAASRKPTAAASRARKKVAEEEDDDDEDDVVEDVAMLDDNSDSDSDSQAMFFKDKSSSASTQRKKAMPVSTRTRKATSPIKKPPPRATTTKGKQATLNFTASQASVLGTGTRGARGPSLSDNIEDASDDDDAFEPVSSARTRSRR